MHLKFPKDLKEKEIFTLAESLADLGCVSSVKPADDRWNVSWFCETKIMAKDILPRLMIQAASHNIHAPIESGDIIIEKSENENWLEKSYQAPEAFAVGPFFVQGAEGGVEPPADSISLKIDAINAFGRGDHPTTKACLMAMADLKSQGVCPWNVLDMGTGSGILAIAAWKLWKTPILAIDNQEEAVTATNHHFKTHDVPLPPNGGLCRIQEGFKGSHTREKGPFDLIIMNILAGPVIEMAHDVKQVSDDNGFVILSGMLKEQADDVLTVYEAEDFTLENRIDIDEWTTLVLRNT